MAYDNSNSGVEHGEGSRCAEMDDPIKQHDLLVAIHKILDHNRRRAVRPGGFMKMAEGTAEVWLAPGRTAQKRRPLLFHRAALRLLDEQAEAFELSRVRVVVQTPEPAPHSLAHRAWRRIMDLDRRWLRLLGFLPVGKPGPTAIFEKTYLERFPFHDQEVN